jgi:hypothetical protein
MKHTPIFAVVILVVALAALLVPNTANAQTTKTSYFMTTSHARHYLNPALYPDHGYIGFPLAGNIYGGLSTNTFTLENFIFQLQDGASAPVRNVTFMHKDVTAEQFLAGLSDHNYLSASASVDFLSMGFRGKKTFWNFHIGLRSRVDADIPKPLFELVKVGFADKDADSTVYNLSGISLSARTRIEIGLGYARSYLGERLHIGIRPKLILGIEDARADIEQLRVAAGEDFWKVRSRATLAISAPGTTKEKDGAFNGFDFKIDGAPGIGGAIDLGASLRVFNLGPLGRLTVSAAANDIGFVKWNGKSTYRASTSDREIVIRPNNYTVGQEEDGASIEDVLDDAIDDFESALDFVSDNDNSSRTTKLNVTFNLGAEYAILNDRLSVGALYSREQAAGYDMNTCTVSANLRPCSWFAASASYALLTTRPSKSVGLALHLSPRVGPSLFIASDCAISKVSKEFIPIGARDMNVQFGLTFNTGGGR